MSEVIFKMKDLMVTAGIGEQIFIHQETPCENGNERALIEVSPCQVDELCRWLREARDRSGRTKR